MRELSSVEAASFVYSFDLVIMDDVDYIGDQRGEIIDEMFTIIPLIWDLDRKR
jgi:hypothetical protein